VNLRRVPRRPRFFTRLEAATLRFVSVRRIICPTLLSKLVVSSHKSGSMVEPATARVVKSVPELAARNLDVHGRRLDSIASGGTVKSQFPDDESASLLTKHTPTNFQTYQA
jgi:hypothetical protein